ncbi:hypothetical protein NQL31_000116 [Lotmaria passim]
MEAVNISTVLRSGESDTASSLTSDTTSTETTSAAVEKSIDASALETHHDVLDIQAKDILRNIDHGIYTEEDFIALFGEEAIGERRPLDGHNDPHNDTLSLRTYWIALFTPQVYMAIFYALRITFMVALPLGILARHPNVMKVFPAHVVIPLWGIVDCRYTFGEQLAFNVVTIQCALWMMLWGTLNNVWNIHDHPAGWWCSVIFIAFTISLFGDVRARRVVVLHSILILQMEKLPGGTELIYPVKVGRDAIMATGFAFFQCLFPVKSIAKECDEMMAGGLKHIGRIVHNCVTACWSEDPIECAIALGHIGTEPIQSLSANLPSKLFFVMYEFWESTLRLELRRERLTVMEACMPRLHTMTDVARAMVVKRVHRAPLKRKLSEGAHARKVKSAADKHSPCEDVEGHKTRSGTGMGMQSHEPYADMEDNNSHDDVAGMQRRLRREAERDKLSQNVETRRTMSNAPNAEQQPERESSTVLMMQYKTPLWKRTNHLLKPAVDSLLYALNAVLEGLGKHLNPHEVAEKVPFADLREAATNLQSKLDEVHFEALIKSETPVDPFLYSNVFVFHLSLFSLAEHLLEYGESMQNFDRSRYKSQLQRAWEFFFYDYWKGFWEELPKRITLATPRDVRIFKDAIKMACAYGLGAMYTEYMDPHNVYYFGMAILMGVGLPTAGDTMEASVYRVTGMVCACSIAYVAIWHTPNLAAELAIALAGVFIALLFRDRPPYAHTAQYCSMLVLTALNSASSKLVLICRIVSNSFTVMSYYAIVVFIFPIDVLRVTYNTQVKAIQLVADRFSRLVDVISQPLSPDDPAQYAAMKAEVSSIRASRVPMWGALNAVGTWLPKAAADPAPLGSPYPLQAMRDMYSSLRRLGSATDVICASLCALLREDVPRHRPDVEHILAAVAPVMHMVDRTGRILFQDFLDALSRPYEWSGTKTTYHLSVFLSLSRALHHACWTAHRRNVKALRANFREKVMNRTFAAAAMSRVVDPQTLERARNLSFAMQSSDAYLPMPVARRGDAEGIAPPPGPQSPTAYSGTGGCGDDPAHPNENADPVNVSAPTSARVHDNPLNSSSLIGPSPLNRRPSTPQSTSMLSCGAPLPSTLEGAEVPPVTNGSIARTIAESVALVRSTERRNSRLVRRDGTSSLSSLPAAAAAGGTAGSALPTAPAAVTGPDADEEAAEQSQCAQEQAVFEKALDPYERQAQEEERRAFIARRSLEHARMEESTLSHDVNMVLTILVGTDMFFGEAERMLKTMYVINEYTRSRQPPPKPKDGVVKS